jgi:FkbM family methyltransferase
MSQSNRLSKIHKWPLEKTVEAVFKKVYYLKRGLTNPISVSVSGRTWRIYHRNVAADLFSVWQCFHKRQYAVPEPSFHPARHSELLQARYERIVSSSRVPVVVDCGANIGVSSVWFSAHYPAAKIIAIEPNPSNISILRKNLTDPNFTIVEGALTRRDGEALLVDTGNGEMGHRLAEVGNGAKVQGFTLKSILDIHTSLLDELFILKIDIEGGEKAIFGQQSWETLDQFPLIILEEHDFMMPGESTASKFFQYHADRRRDFMFSEENIFSFDYASLSGQTNE